jgi:hypothetical protein
VGCKGITFICLYEAVLRVIVSPSWGPALCHHGSQKRCSSCMPFRFAFLRPTPSIQNP